MTVLVPLNAFEDSHEVRRIWRPERDRVTGVAITIAIHALIVVAALTAVQVAHPKALQELTVQITPERPKPAAEIAPPKHLAVPTTVTAPLPDVVIQTVTPPPVVAAPPPAATPMAVPQAVARAVSGAGETRDSFLARLLAQLNRYKQYPRAARQAHIEGVVMLHFVMDADGKVQNFEIAKSSGRPVLDNEALALIARAQPLPALPPDFPTRTMDAVVPIQFSLNS
jgi:protein TonB